jgi:hypothetical protein
MWPQVKDFIEFLYNNDGYQNYTHQQVSSFLDEAKSTIRYIQSDKIRVINELEQARDSEKELLRLNQIFLNQIQEQQYKINNLSERYKKKLTFWERLSGKLK